LFKECNMVKDERVDFGYYVEKAFSQDCELVKHGKIYFLTSKESEVCVKLKSLSEVNDHLNKDSRFQKYEFLPRAF